MIKIAVKNESSLTDVEAEAPMKALQTQLDRDFAPLWGISAVLEFVKKGGPIPNDAWQIGIFDNSDQPGALGYHDLTSAGLPLGKIFQATDAVYKEDWHTTLSHELLEMLVDPDINLTVFEQTSNSAGTLYAYESCDPVQNNSYDIDGTMVSDFVTPAYFETFRGAGVQFDFMKVLARPVPALAPGGYLSYYKIGGGKGWQQKTAEGVSARRSRPHHGSRRHLRGIDRDAWRCSEAR